MNLDGLRAALDELVARVPAAADRGRPRLWVDRSFAARGSGTVVTGTLTGGPLAVGDEVVDVPGRTIGAGAGRCRPSGATSTRSDPATASP